MLETKFRPRFITFKLPRFSARYLLTWTSAVMGGILIAVFAAGGSYALWNGTAEIPDTVVTSGTIGLTVDDVSGLNIDALVPGDSVVTAFTAWNYGDVDLSVVMSSTAITSQTNGLASYLTLILANVASSDCSKDVAGTSGPAIGFTSTTTPVLIDAGASTEYCLVVTLSASLASPQDSTAAFTLTFEGYQPTS